MKLFLNIKYPVNVQKKSNQLIVNNTVFIVTEKIGNRVDLMLLATIKCSYYNKNKKQEKLAFSQNIHRNANAHVHSVIC